MSVVSKAELSEGLTRCRQRLEFWQLRAKSAEFRVSELEEAIREHQRAVKENVTPGGSTDRALWKLVKR
jgi:hypothetical protein